jgi:hypothetical protein
MTAFGAKRTLAERPLLTQSGHSPTHDSRIFDNKPPG